MRREIQEASTSNNERRTRRRFWIQPTGRRRGKTIGGPFGDVATHIVDIFGRAIFGAHLNDARCSTFIAFEAFPIAIVT
jgi:hypothetical protein